MASARTFLGRSEIKCPISPSSSAWLIMRNDLLALIPSPSCIARAVAMPFVRNNFRDSSN